MPMKEEEVKQLPVTTGSRRNVSPAKRSMSRLLELPMHKIGLHSVYGRFTRLCWVNMSPEHAPQAKLPIPTMEEIIYSE